jgi:hypothetical protein
MHSTQQLAAAAGDALTRHPQVSPVPQERTRSMTVRIP